MDVTIKTIAEEAGVSTSLVSQVLNDRPVRVSQETRKRIHEVAKRHHYVSNKLASSLKSKQTNIIALAAPFTPNGFFSNLIYHVQYYAQQAGYMSMVVNTFNQAKAEGEALALYQSGMFDGMLLACRNEDTSAAILSRMQESSYPFVYVDRGVGDVPATMVSSDHAQVGRMLTEAMLDAGKRDIVYLYNREDSNTTLLLRRSGYDRAHAERSLTPTHLPFSCIDGERTTYVEAIGEALATLGRQPDAIFAHSGYYLPALVYACKQVGFKLDRMYFTTVDGYSFSQGRLDVGETMRQVNGRCAIAIQDIDTIAKEAVRLLLDRIQGRSEDAEHVMVPVDVVEL